MAAIHLSGVEYQPTSDFERVVLRQLGELTKSLQRLDGRTAACKEAADAAVSLCASTHAMVQAFGEEVRAIAEKASREIEALRIESEVLSGAAVGARAEAEHAAERAEAAEERSKRNGNGHVIPSEQPTDPDLPKYSSHPPKADAE